MSPVGKLPRLPCCCVRRPFKICQELLVRTMSNSKILELFSRNVLCWEVKSNHKWSVATYSEMHHNAKCHGLQHHNLTNFPFRVTSYHKSLVSFCSNLTKLRLITFMLSL